MALGTWYGYGRYSPKSRHSWDFAYSQVRILTRFVIKDVVNTMRLQRLLTRQYLDTANGGPARPWRNRGSGTLAVASSTADQASGYCQGRPHSLRLLTPCLPPQTYINRTEPNGKPLLFWGRGNGWAISRRFRAGAAAAAARPPPRRRVPRRSSWPLAAELKAIQGPDGLWRASLADATALP